jgi:hypothetical protein
MGATGTRVELTRETDLSEERIHTVLSNERRRLALEHLRAEGGTDLPTLAERVAVSESGEDPPPEDVRRSVYVSLQQRHVPRLVDARIVRYDEQSKRVALDGRFETVAAYMERTRSDDAAWTDVYAGLAVLGCLSTLSAAYDVVPGAVVGHAVAVFLLVGAAALYQRTTARR